MCTRDPSSPAAHGQVAPDAGWHGDSPQARLGYTAAASLRYRLTGEIGRFLHMLQDESQHDVVQQAFGRSMGDVADFWADIGRSFEGTLDEARELTGVLVESWGGREVLSRCRAD